MPKTENCQMGRDHAVYIKQYNNVDVTSNYFSGWPQDATGSVKFRNAKNLYFAGNYLNQVAFDARAYDNSHILEMSDTFIFNNIIEETSISYWQNFTDTENIFISVKNFIVFNNFFKSKDKNKVRISSTPRNKFGEFLESQNQYTDFVPVTTRDFEHVNISTAKSRLPKEKKALLTLKPAPLWKQAGQITGPNLTDNQLVRMDIHIEGYSKQFVVYVPPSDYYYPAYRWAPGLAQNLNSTIHGVCAGVLTDKVTTNNRCKFLKTTGSSYQNFLYATEGESVKYTINVLDKYKKINAIYAPSALSAGQAVKFNVRFEDGTENEVVYTPSDYMLPAYRWPKGLATEINQRIPGLCAGQYTTEKDNNTEATQCLYAAPVASSYENNIYTINGQSAITTMSIIEIGAP
ncbi:hypothetical protein [Brucella grignonensis]|uniref:Putative exported domain protein n=1 Tax=Brucella grignonensis TaxID=94627 RepID=A0A256G3E3_9HYPH|nr:hypothetical protein [Brucella grignonensis]OYR21500.1 putative exported domain protein [Brucella grignonensis]